MFPTSESPTSPTTGTPIFSSTYSPTSEYPSNFFNTGAPTSASITKVPSTQFPISSQPTAPISSQPSALSPPNSVQPTALPVTSAPSFSPSAPIVPATLGPSLFPITQTAPLLAPSLSPVTQTVLPTTTGPVSISARPSNSPSKAPTSYSPQTTQTPTKAPGTVNCIFCKRKWLTINVCAVFKPSKSPTAAGEHVHISMPTLFFLGFTYHPTPSPTAEPIYVPPTRTNGPTRSPTHAPGRLLLHE